MFPDPDFDFFLAMYYHQASDSAAPAPAANTVTDLCNDLGLYVSATPWSQPQPVSSFASGAAAAVAPMPPAGPGAIESAVPPTSSMLSLDALLAPASCGSPAPLVADLISPHFAPVAPILPPQQQPQSQYHVTGGDSAQRNFPALTLSSTATTLPPYAPLDQSVPLQSSVSPLVASYPATAGAPSAGTDMFGNFSPSLPVTLGSVLPSPAVTEAPHVTSPHVWNPREVGYNYDQQHPQQYPSYLTQQQQSQPQLTPPMSARSVAAEYPSAALPVEAGSIVQAPTWHAVDAQQQPIQQQHVVRSSHQPLQYPPQHHHQQQYQFQGRDMAATDSFLPTITSVAMAPMNGLAHEYPYQQQHQQPREKSWSSASQAHYHHHPQYQQQEQYHHHSHHQQFYPPPPPPPPPAQHHHHQYLPHQHPQQQPLSYQHHHAPQDSPLGYYQMPSSSTSTPSSMLPLDLSHAGASAADVSLPQWTVPSQHASPMLLAHSAIAPSPPTAVFNEMPALGALGALAPAAESGLTPLVHGLAIPSHQHQQQQEQHASPPATTARLPKQRKARATAAAGKKGKAKASGGSPRSSPSRRALNAQVRGAAAAAAASKPGTTTVPLPSIPDADLRAGHVPAPARHKSYFIFGPHSYRLMVRYLLMETGELDRGGVHLKYPTEGEIAAALKRDRRPVITKKRWARLQGNLQAIPRDSVAVPGLIAPPVSERARLAVPTAQNRMAGGPQTPFLGGNHDEVVHKLPRGRRVRAATASGWDGIDAGVLTDGEDGEGGDDDDDPLSVEDDGGEGGGDGIDPEAAALLAMGEADRATVDRMSLVWRGDSLLIMPRSEWPGIFRAAHTYIDHREGCAGGTDARACGCVVRHRSLRDTLDGIRMWYQTRRSRCGFTLGALRRTFVRCTCCASRKGGGAAASAAMAAAVAASELEDDE
ncbi:hypothetical protein H9P43_002483 [Blastocladiella emersonii ATCC 22665]|nr:hypothetical protein H9P43_002483 [Blastocladiella emersonii ATCC 22665]